MKETQTTFDIFGENTNTTSLNNEVLEDFEDIEIIDPKDGLSNDHLNETPKFESSINNDVSNSLDNIEKNLKQIDDALNLEKLDVELDLRNKININTADLGKMDEIRGKINIVEEVKSNDAISLNDDDKLYEGAESKYGKVNIVTIGIGGCGVNTIGRMYNDRRSNIKLISIDTSRKSLEANEADHKILLGENIFNGHGSGGKFDEVSTAIQSEMATIRKYLTGVDMLFITGGLGKGTGSVGLVEIGKLAREMDILTIGFAILPKPNEADPTIVRKYYSDFIQNVDSNIIIENERINEVYRDLSIRKAQKMADKMLIDGIRGISDLITSPGKINLDYADVKTAFSNKGSVVMGIGYAKGENAVIDAIRQSINTDIVDFNNIKTARDIIFNISCAKNTITIGQASKGTELIYSYSDGDQIEHLFFGYSYDETLNDQVKVTFIATGTGARDINEITYQSSSAKPKTNAAVDLFGNVVTPKKSKPKENNENSTETRTLDLPDFFSKK